MTAPTRPSSSSSNTSAGGEGAEDAKDASAALRDLGHEHDGERISVTDVNGTVARFEMSYEPPKSERQKFGPPIRSWIPSLVYAALALVVVGLVVVGYNSSPSSKLFIWIVEGDKGRALGSQVLAAIIAVSALATVIRTNMRGVVVSPDWIEARYLLPLGIPRAKRWGWPTVHRIVIDSRAIDSGDTRAQIGLELYNGGFERLPEVRNPKGLRDHLLHHASKRRIQVTELGRPD